MEIGAVGTVNALERTRLETCLAQINPLMIHPFVEGAAVIEYAVQNDAHAAAVQFPAQDRKQFITLFQVFHTGNPADIFRRVTVVLFPGLHNMVHIIGNDAEMRINMLVILAVVFVAGRRNKNRVEVQDLDPQILQVIQLIQDALEIAAVEAADIGVCRNGVPVGDMLGMADSIVILIVHYIIGRIAVTETIRKNLVLNRAFGPIRHMETRHKAESVGGIEIGNVMLIGTGAAFIISDFCTVRTLDQETVDYLRIIADNTGFVIIKKVITLYPDHLCSDGHRIEDENHTLRTVFGNTQTDHDGIAAVGL